MFYSVPVNNEQIITSTPIGARCITHVFFESKNDGVFDYKRNADAVTISIDGKMICRDVPVLPFLSSTTYGVNRYKWQDVALEVGINVNLSEIKISAQTINDFNVVFVYSNQESKKFDGFDFVECKRISIVDRTTASMKDERENVIKRLVAGETVSFKGNTYALPYKVYGIEVTSATTLTKAQIFATEGACTFVGINVPYAENEAKLGYDSRTISGGSTVYHVYYEVSSVASENALEGKVLREVLQRAQYDDRSISFNWGAERVIALDREPQKMFAASYMSHTENKAWSYMNGDVKLNFTISGTDQEEFAPQTALDVMCVSNNIAWRECVHEFGQIMPRSFMFTLDYERQYDNNGALIPISSVMGGATGGWYKYSKIADVNTWDVFLMFIYKKIQ